MITIFTGVQWDVAELRRLVYTPFLAISNVTLLIYKVFIVTKSIAIFASTTERDNSWSGDLGVATLWSLTVAQAVVETTARASVAIGWSAWLCFLIAHIATDLLQCAFLCINTLRPRQNGSLFADDTFKRIFFNEHIRISIKISLKFVPKGLINNIAALVQIMAWRRPGDTPLSEPTMVRSLTHICVTRPQWVKGKHPMVGWCESGDHLLASGGGIRCRRRRIPTPDASKWSPDSHHPTSAYFPFIRTYLWNKQQLMSINLTTWATMQYHVVVDHVVFYVIHSQVRYEVFYLIGL